MPRSTAALFGLLLLCACFGSAVVAAQAKPARWAATELSTEYKRNPLGVDSAQPMLGWLLSSARRGQKQTAYQVLVASTSALLASNKGDLWSSGKVFSGQSFQVPYRGAALKSDQRCFWKVRTWDKSGAASPWSEPTFWQMGLLARSDWSARWISPPAPEPSRWREYDVEVDLRIIRKQIGVVFRAQDTQNLYMWQFSVDGGKPRLRPHLCLDGNWQSSAVDLPPQSLPATQGEGGAWSTGWHHLKLEVRDSGVKTYIDQVLVDTRSLGSFSQVLPSGTVGFRGGDSSEEGAFKSLSVKATDGKSLLADSFSGENNFSSGTIDSAGQQLVVANSQLALSKSGIEEKWRSPLLRRDFVLPKKVRRATAYAFGLGWYELHLNGAKADNRVLAPANSVYGRRKLYDVYDVTRLLKPGGNAVGLWLGEGYRTRNYSRWGWSWDGMPGALLQINIVYQDGSTQRIVSDERWACAQSPITLNHIYHGESYDARRDRAGWDRFGQGELGWQPVRAEVLSAALGSAELSPNPAPPITVAQRLRPRAMFHSGQGVYVFDMGQNFAGWARLQVRGPAGTQVTLRHSEEIDPATHAIDPWTNRDAQATDTYTLRGALRGTGPEVYEPRFTYHGFRYVEVRGFPGTPTLDSVSGCVVHTAAEVVGRFQSSDALLNRIQSNIVWGIGSNQMSIPTDCPQRDERTPCQMDSAAYEEAAIQNFGLHGYYSKWLGDIRGDTGNPDWSGDQVTLAWHLYRFYGDRRILADSYESLRKYLDSHLRQISDSKDENYLFRAGFGDWCAPNPDGSYGHSFSSVRETNTALYCRHLSLFSEMARLLGKASDAQKYAALAQEARSVFNREFWQEDKGQYGDGKQTTALLPLALGLVPEDRKPRLLQSLLRTMQIEDKGHLNTGIYGTRFLMDALADEGEVDTAYHALSQKTYPGFGYQIANGATTLWEQWHIKGGMQSHNHAMFSGIGASFYTRLGGITPGAPGYSKIIINPAVPRGLAWVQCSIKTVAGVIESSWRAQDSQFRHTVTIPANTWAEVHLPARSLSAISESGKPLAQNPDVQFLRFEKNRAVLAVGSGTYSFAINGANSLGARH